MEEKISNIGVVAAIFNIVMAVVLFCNHLGNEATNTTNSKRFIIESEVSNSVQIIYDYDTKVQYLLDIDGGICVRVDANGKPMLHKD